MSRQRGTAFSPGEALEWPIKREPGELVSSCSTELRGGSPFCGIARLTGVQKGKP